MNDSTKKSAPRAAKIENAQAKEHAQFDYIKTGAMAQAQRLFDQIGTGKAHAVKVSHRDNNNSVARGVRLLVQIANQNGDFIINIGDGSGYFRPDLNDPQERDDAIHYIRSLLAKANSLYATAQALGEAIGIEGVTP